MKCDEGKPHCERCVSTGRKCDGYAPVTTTPSTLSWHRPRNMFPNVDDARERRALEFFCRAAGPSLSGPMDPYFWTHLVMQFSGFEPAVRHSIVSISSLYEQVRAAPESILRLADNRLALSHYNLAIRELKSMNNEPLVLMVCILFICIEILLGNREAAIQHCKHGVVILENVEASYPWTKKYLSPIFRRLTLFPFFFGSGSASFPKLLGLDDQMPASFSSMEEAQYYLDGIVTRTVGLVRQGDSYRLGNLRSKPVPSELLSQQDTIRSALNQWQSRFADFQNEAPSRPRPDEMLCNTLLRYEIAQIWVETAFEYDETAYDRYLDRFRWMVSEAANIYLSRISEGDTTLQETPKFIFEMGFIPLLYYVVIKCRCLETRIQALSLMKMLGVVRENLWELSSMHAAGRRVIEIEHAVLLDKQGQISTMPGWPGLPPDEMRVRDSTTSPRPFVNIDEQGQETRGRMAGFFRRTIDGNIYLQSEVILET